MDRLVHHDQVWSKSVRYTLQDLDESYLAFTNPSTFSRLLILRHYQL